MKFFCVFVCISFAALALADESEEGGKIVGGTAVKITDHPYQASMRTTKGGLCGASYIGSSRVLTAAHCTYNLTASQITVRAGSDKYNSGGETRTVKTIRQHPNYSSTTFNNDIAVLILTSDFPTTSAIRAITLGSKRLADGTEVNVTGYGTTKEDGSLPTTLQGVRVPIVSSTVCNTAYGGITANMICAGLTDGGKDSCQGDSGGPLARYNELYGVTSFGYGCARSKYPGVYTNVPNYVSWINSVSN